MTKNKKGFTIIEVVLVLAIAGLIFLMVFIALPALQRSQRNTRRRQDMSRILAQFTEYQSNNAGKMPDSSTINDFVNRYLIGSGTQGNSLGADCESDQFCDPDGTAYFIEVKGERTDSNKTWSANFPNDHKIGYFNNAKCSGTEGEAGEGSGDRDIAIFYVLEGGAVYCGDNQ